MASGFYRTSYENVGKEPQRAIDFVTKSEDRVQASLADGLYFNDVYDVSAQPVNRPDPQSEPKAWAWPDLCDRSRWGGRQAGVLISGTTDEIVRGLQRARVDGIEGFWSTGDRLLVWYLRRSRTDVTKSLVLVAPQGLLALVQADDPAACFDYSRKEGWRYMAATSRENQDKNYTGLSLKWLITNVVPKGEGVTGWW
jgi:hypothetical protein